VRLEVGWRIGVSADEAFDDGDDKAWYVGLRVLL
jgi:hypothetical protein